MKSGPSPALAPTGNEVSVKPRPPWSVVGAVVGVMAADALAGAAWVTGGLLLAVVAATGVTVISYVVADAKAGSGFGTFMRGFMVGFNAGLNVTIATALVGPVVGIAPGVITFLAAFAGMAANPIYRQVLGWSSWLLPMSWPATGIGLVFFVVNAVAAFFTSWMPRWLGGSGWGAAQVKSVSLHRGTGTIVTHGGLLTPVRGGYNLGNFVYIHRDSDPGGVLEHEIGHTLNVAAFGSLFHFIGAIDENVIPRRGARAYAEKLAASNDPAHTVADRGVSQDMWA